MVSVGLAAQCIRGRVRWKYRNLWFVPNCSDNFGFGSSPSRPGRSTALAGLEIHVSTKTRAGDAGHFFFLPGSVRIPRLKGGPMSSVRVPTVCSGPGPRQTAPMQSTNRPARRRRGGFGRWEESGGETSAGAAGRAEVSQRRCGCRRAARRVRALENDAVPPCRCGME